MNTQGHFLYEGDLAFFSHSSANFDQLASWVEGDNTFGVTVIFLSLGSACLYWCLGLGLPLFVFIGAELGNMTLFVAGETVPFFALGLNVWILGFSNGGSASGLLSPIVFMGTISPSVHCIGVNLWHLDSQDLGPLLWSKSGVVHLLVAETLLGDLITDAPDVLYGNVVLVVLTCSVLPPVEMIGSDHLQDMVHHLVG